MVLVRRSSCMRKGIPSELKAQGESEDQAPGLVITSGAPLLCHSGGGRGPRPRQRRCLDRHVKGVESRAGNGRACRGNEIIGYKLNYVKIGIFHPSLGIFISEV